uniref:Programmed cell death protein 2 C-terminal domain-containing protein n=1 Tax=Eutreptiella gymnastica TaxID=73025 RepID=A0A7S4LJL5_9EUGL
MWVAVPYGAPSADELKDPYESQIGGQVKVPEWANFDPRRAQCGVCGHPLYLMLQAFCPFEDLERIFLVYACNTEACHAQPSKCWQAWRLQRTIEKKGGDQEGDGEKDDDGDADADAGPGDTEDSEDDDAGSLDDKAALTGLPPSAPYCLPCFSLDMFPEPEQDDSETDVAAEMRKMEEINKKTDAAITAKDLDSVAHSVPQFKPDETFAAFQIRMELCPRQVVRWEIGAVPLWISNEKIPHELPECKACGAPCVVELQLMPTIVYVLKPYNHTHVAGDEGLDFGTVTVYSCSQMCRGTDICPEHVHIQPPPSE